MPSPGSTPKKTTSKNNAPAAPTVPAGGTASQSLTADPYNLSYQGVGDLANTPIDGGYEFFGQSATVPGPTTTKKSQRLVLTAPKQAMNATDAMKAFVGLTGSKLATVQDQLYRADMYGGNYVPHYGQLSAEDVAAFRRMMIGYASNPSQGTLTSYLQQAAQQGTQQGTSGVSSVGKVVQLSNPDDLRITLQKTVRDLYGGNLPESDVQRFISAYQSQEAQAQSAAAGDKSSADFASGLYNPTTGMAQGTQGGVTATVTAPQSPSGAAETYVRTNYPNEVAGNYLGNQMESIFQMFRQGE